MERKTISKIRNPFKFGSIVEKDNFCNRAEELKTIKQYINDSYSIWLYSPRRFGKSSLVKKVFAETEDFITIYMDLYNVKSLEDFARKFSSQFVHEAFDWKDELYSIAKKASHYLKNLHPSISFDAEGQPSFQLEKKKLESQSDIESIINMPEQWAIDHGKKVCIAFDEFQEIERIEPFIINWMRSSFQNHKNVSYIFLGSKKSLMETIFTDISSPFYEFAIKFHLDNISHKDFSKYIKDKFKENGLEIKKQTINNILGKSKLHPHFTQYFSSVVFDHIRNGANQNKKDFTNTWMDSILNSQGITFQNIYDQLSSNQRTTLSAIALSDESTELFSSQSKKEFNLPTSSTLTVSLNSLIKKELINKNNKKYELINPVFNEWLIRLNTRQIT